MMNRLTDKLLAYWAMCIILCIALSRPLLGKEPKKDQGSLKPVFSITDGDVWKLHPWGAWLDAFDISPDGKTFAAEFNALEANHKAATWVGEWDMATRKLIAEQLIDDQSPAKQLPTQNIFDLRFTSDGRKLAALTGTRVMIVDAADLRVLYSIYPAKIQPAPRYGVVIRQVLISADGRRLAVVSSGVGFPWGAINVRIFSVSTGEELGVWNLSQSGWGSEFSLSPDGSEMLVSRSQSDRPMPADVMLVDSRTGAVLRTFDSGFGSRGSGYAGSAQFVDNDRFLVTSVSSSGASHYAIKIVDLQTGNVLQELGYSKHDAQARAVAATGTPLIAAFIFSWKWGIGSDLDAPLSRAIDWLALFRLSQEEPFYVRRMVTLFQAGGPGGLMIRNTIRISPDGRFLAFGTGKAIQVYSVEAGQQKAQTKHRIWLAAGGTFRREVSATVYAPPQTWQDALSRLTLLAG